MNATHFRDLDVWRVAMELARCVYGLTDGFPREERYGLSSQMQRSAVSIPSNIAEGNARQSMREYARFVSIASGSVAELQTQLLLAEQLGLGGGDSVKPVLELAERVSKMLYRLQQSLSRAPAGSRVTRHSCGSPFGPSAAPMFAPASCLRSPGPGSRISESAEEYV